MTREPVTIHVDQPLHEAARRMKVADVGVLFAVDGDELVGVVTDRDLVTRALPLDGATVLDAITRHVIACSVDASLGTAARLMARQRVRRLAVIDGDRELVGVLALADVARQGKRGAQLAAVALRAICARMESAKAPARDDPTGGRRRGSPAGILHVYAPRPRLCRRPAAPDSQ